MDVIQRLFDLKQSASGAVVSEAGHTDLQKRMHVPDAIEDWILSRVGDWRDAGRGKPLLVMLSGNAGDGKSDLIERILARLGEIEDVDVIRDATHADAPTSDQMAQLAEFFSSFADGAQPGLPSRVSLIAMNTGMALSFLAAARDGAYGRTFRTLEEVLKNELGLAAGAPAPPWEFEVVNLDRRSLLRLGSEPSLFDGMLDRLDPENPAGVLSTDGERCATCAARAACFVRTNLELLRLPVVRESLSELLWQTTLEGDVHLSPRNLWDLLYQVTTGGESYFEGFSTPCERIGELAEKGARGVPEIQTRLLYNLLFESPSGTPRGHVLDALTNADPSLRTGRNGHLAESAAYNDPKADSDEMGRAAAYVGAANGGATDPCLDYIGSVLDEPMEWTEGDRRLFGRSVVRRATLLDNPSTISGEVQDPDLGDFMSLLDAYARWQPGGVPPEALRDFKRLLVQAIGRIFGTSVGTNTYFRQDSFSPATRFPAFAQVDLAETIEPVPDDDVARGSHWLGAVNYRPQYVSIEIRGNGDNAERAAWRIRGNLALFRLFRRVLSGYAASSVDLEAFFGLRYACERLGSTSRGDDLVIRGVDDGRVYRLQQRTEMGQEVIELIEV
jgi:hypothetical protein